MFSGRKTGETPAAHSAPLLVEDADSLGILIDALSAEQVFAVDTESNSLFAYKERVCLIQFSTAHRDFILDPFRFTDLSALAPLFADPSREKIFHAAEYDVLCLKRDYGFEFQAIFDTMVAARTLGWQRTGLAVILEERLGVQISKKHQRANWGMRPLPQSLIDYAQQDTHHLLALRDIQWKELVSIGRHKEAVEEFARVARLQSDRDSFHPDDFWRVKGAGALTPRQAAVLRELYIYREKQAERANLPRFKVLGDRTLMAMALEPPSRMGELSRFEGMSPRQIQRHGQALLKAIARGHKASTPKKPRYQRLPMDVRNRYELLQQWRKEKGKTRGVEPDVILPRQALWILAHSLPRTLADLDLLEDIGAHRRELYGSEILELLNGEEDGKDTGTKS